MTRGRGSGPAPHGVRMTPLDWFQLLYTGAETGWLTLSFKRDASTRQDPGDPFRTEWLHVANLELAAQRAESLADEYNVYFGVGLRRERLADGQRGTSQDVASLPGLWVEVDCDAGTHAGSAKAYFPSKAKAQVFLEGLPHRPTAVVDSGGGLHAYWLFREPWVFDADELDYAAALLRGWQGYLRSRAQALGYAVDYTHDLARVLRPAGTWNRKNGRPLPVQPVWTDGPRYNPSDFDEWMDWTATTVPGAPRDFVLRPGAQPPAARFAALIANDKKFRDSWDETRRDLKDQSTSGYALALASIAAATGWSNQELCDLLVAFREKRPRENKKGLGWYVRTIAKAQQGTQDAAQSARAVERVTEATEVDEKLAGLSKLLGFTVRRFIKRRPVDPSNYLCESSYVLETSAGNVAIGDSETLISLQRMRALIVDKLNHQIKVKAKDWPAIVDAMLAVMVVEDAPIEQSPYEEIRMALTRYLETKGSTKDPLTAYDGDLILLLDGKRWFNLPRFAEWCRIRLGMRVGTNNLPRMLLAVGCTRRTFGNLLRAGQRTMIVVWSTPEEL